MALFKRLAKSNCPVIFIKIRPDISIFPPLENQDNITKVINYAQFVVNQAGALVSRTSPDFIREAEIGVTWDVQKNPEHIKYAN